MNDIAKVVGVYHRGIKNAREILDSMSDTRMDVLLRAEPNNPYDANAIAVYVQGLKFGYISHNDICRVPLRTAHLAISDEILTATTTSCVNLETGSFFVEFSTDHLFRINAFDETGREWDNWHTDLFDSAPLLSVVNDVQADIDMLIHLNRMDNKSRVIKTWSVGLRRIGCLPLWKEAQSDLISLISSYENSDSSSKKDAAEELRHMVSAIGSPVHRQAYVDEWWPVFLQSDDVRHFVLTHPDITKDSILKEIMSLPGHLGLLLADRVSFFSSIYYRRISLKKWNTLMWMLAVYDTLEKGALSKAGTNYFLGQTQYIENNYERNEK